ncbi:MAG: serine hydroxymethyltransferase [Candidatus Micrarchaeota archaeon]|nr:serine hydroxymethyltransferase [Candidatus Micrarchaeota archaeon]
MADSKLQARDPKIYEALKNELQRQREGLEMIPSENFTSLAVMEAMGSVLTNKYSEGYPSHRYYGGNHFIDVVEQTAIDRAKELFKVPHANVQAYSGSPANLAVYLATCKPGDVIMGMNLTDGGHLTHGWKTSVTGQIFKSVPYHVKADGYIDIEEARRLAQENKPKLIWVGCTAYTREFPFKEFAEIADSVGAYLAADISHIAGLVVAGAHESPKDYAHVIMTTTHKTMRGPRGALIMVTEKGMRKDPELGEKINKTIFPGMQGGPHENVIAGIATALLEASTPDFREYGQQIVRNAKALASSLMANGMKLVTDGTVNHMVLIDLTPLGKGKGAFAEYALEVAGITVNKNTIPKEPASPFYPSGVRLGTPALTTRGMREQEMNQIGRIIAEACNEIKYYSMPENKEERSAYLAKFRDEAGKNPKLQALKKEVIELCAKFPLYPDLGS